MCWHEFSQFRRWDIGSCLDIEVDINDIMIQYIVNIYIPWKSKDYFLNCFFRKDYCFLVGIYNQQFKGTILFMVFDFQGIYIYG